MNRLVVAVGVASLVGRGTQGEPARVADGAAATTGSTDPRCTDPDAAAKHGQMTTVVWQPA